MRKNGTLDSVERARESVSKGATLPESAMAKMSGDYRPSPVSTGLESENALLFEGGVIGEAEYFALKAHPECAVCRELFRLGWTGAMYGWHRTSGPSELEKAQAHGHDTYRRVRGINGEG